jgi:hypothetical protein
MNKRNNRLAWYKKIGDVIWAKCRDEGAISLDDGTCAKLQPQTISQRITYELMEVISDFPIQERKRIFKEWSKIVQRQLYYAIQYAQEKYACKFYWALTDGGRRIACISLDPQWKYGGIAMEELDFRRIKADLVGKTIATKEHIQLKHMDKIPELQGSVVKALNPVNNKDQYNDAVKASNITEEEDKL